MYTPSSSSAAAVDEDTTTLGGGARTPISREPCCHMTYTTSVDRTGTPASMRCSSQCYANTGHTDWGPHESGGDKSAGFQPPLYKVRGEGRWRGSGRDD